MLENCLMPQLNEDSNDYIFQQDGSPAHYKDVRGYFNRNLPKRWKGCTGKEDDALMRWPPRSPDLPRATFSSRGLWRTLSLCLHSSLISRFSKPYHRCCGSDRPWYTDTCVKRDGLSHRCLPYYQRWTHWAPVKCVKKKTWRVFLSIGVRTTMIRLVVYCCEFLKCFTDLWITLYMHHVEQSFMLSF